MPRHKRLSNNGSVGQMELDFWSMGRWDDANWWLEYAVDLRSPKSNSSSSLKNSLLKSCLASC
jgi:hypothetical protein